MTSPAGRTLLINAAAAAVLAGTLPAQAQSPAQTPSSAQAQTPSSTEGAPATAGAARKKPEAAAGKAPPSEKSAVSYSLGVSMGEQLRASYVAPDAVSPDRLAQGVRDGLNGKAKLADADREKIGKLLRGAHDAAGDVNHHAAAAFLADNAKKPDVVTTASGLQYKVLTPGSGDSPKATDEVTVNYRGTLLDGTEFDSSYKRGQPASFPLNRVIPGWSEGLQLMKPGAKYQLFVPPQLGYDLRSPPGSPIPPGAMLIFEVELIGIKPPPPPTPALQGPGPSTGAPAPSSGSKPPAK